MIVINLSPTKNLLPDVIKILSASVVRATSKNKEKAVLKIFFLEVFLKNEYSFIINYDNFRQKWFF